MKANGVRRLARKAGQGAVELTCSEKRALVRKAQRRGKIS